MTRSFEFINVLATGQTVTTVINTSTGNTFPLASNAAKPRFVRFRSTGTCYIRIGVGAQTAVNTDLMMVVSGVPIILGIGGCTHWAAIDDGVSVKLNVTPLEDS